MSECFKGWTAENGNKSSRCCCNCREQVTIMSHPWNVMSGGRMKGPVTTVAGYGCAVMVPEGGNIIFFENEHSMCEMHTFKGVPK